MLYDEFKKIRIDRIVKSIIGMSRDQFEDLVPYFSSSYQEIQEERYQNKEIRWIPKGGKRGVFSGDDERLFFILYYLKTYPTFGVLGFLFGLSEGRAHDYVAFFMRILERALSVQYKTINPLIY